MEAAAFQPPEGKAETAAAAAEEETQMPPSVGVTAALNAGSGEPPVAAHRSEVDATPPQECWVPRVGDEFDSVEEVWEFWNNYGRRVGFGCRKKYTHSNKDGGKITSGRFVCSKQGFRQKDKRDDQVKKHRAETRTGCAVRMGFLLNHESRKYRIHDLELEHNHILHTGETSHMMPSQRKVLDKHDISTIPNHHILDRRARQTKKRVVHDNNGRSVVDDINMDVMERYKIVCPKLVRLAAICAEDRDTFCYVNENVEIWLKDLERIRQSKRKENGTQMEPNIEHMPMLQCVGQSAQALNKKNKNGGKRLKGLKEKLPPKGGKGKKNGSQVEPTLSHPSTTNCLDKDIVNVEVLTDVTMASYNINAQSQEIVALSSQASNFQLQQSLEPPANNESWMSFLPIGLDQGSKDQSQYPHALS